MHFYSFHGTFFVSITLSGEVWRQGHHARLGDSEEQDWARQNPERVDPQQREGQSRVHHSVPLQVIILLSTTSFRLGIIRINYLAQWAKFKQMAQNLIFCFTNLELFLIIVLQWKRRNLCSKQLCSALWQKKWWNQRPESFSGRFSWPTLPQTMSLHFYIFVFARNLFCPFILLWKAKPHHMHIYPTLKNSKGSSERTLRKVRNMFYPSCPFTIFITKSWQLSSQNLDTFP